MVEFYIIGHFPNFKSSFCDITFEIKAVWMACKGICSRYKAQKPMWERGRYASGQRRCQICEMFIEWDGLWCPCCGYRVRSKPRNSKYKAKLRQDTSEIHSKGPEIYSIAGHLLWIPKLRPPLYTFNVAMPKGVSSEDLSHMDKAYWVWRVTIRQPSFLFFIITTKDNEDVRYHKVRFSSG